MERQLLPRPEASPTSPPATSPSDKSPATSKRRKDNVTPIACVECKRKKAKCDGVKPACRRCVDRGVDCVYNAISPSQRMNVLREQIKQYEAELKRLRSKNAFLASSSSDAVTLVQDAQVDSENSL